MSKRPGHAGAPGGRELITLQLKEPLPGLIDAGTDFSIAVGVTAPAALLLGGTPFLVKDSDRIVLEGRLPEPAGELRDTIEITIAAPEEVGEFQWTFVLPARDVDGTHYDEASLPFSFRTQPHETSLAVWGAPSPVIVGQTFTVHAGARCTAGCALGGQSVEIRSADGTIVARGTLGDTPWPQTAALYWAPIDVCAPRDEGRFSWTVSFSAEAPQLPHGQASASFGFQTVRHPDHDVTIKVVEKDALVPVAGAQVRLGGHRASTDETGTARLSVSAGEHHLSLWKAGYDVPETTIRVSASQEVQVEVTKLPEPDPFAFWRG
jgi:hypothetical protein